MSLNSIDKERIRILWSKISKDSDAIGAEALGRLFAAHPQTKTYSTHFKDFTYNSPQVKEHGKLVMKGIKQAYENIDDMVTGLLDLSEKHAFTLRVDPSNFKLLSSCFHVVLSKRYPNDYTDEAHLSFDKFLANVALALSEKYR
ncbi:hemoglobin, alpha embryonic 5 [Cynoglossus semilaevis]|uniref:Hemoglobin-2 n=1 Tax=Cynoglossus semilaevis TaxID=244447 RepID=E2JF88_CYNSE|nr:hemoglobin, alpha embryonic 5 [Cynoglossus semilaevis]ADO17548.1 hemoglobin-2 [Cynoglossus semilaevis]